MTTPETLARADVVNHPPHYTAHPSGIECIQVTEHMGFCIGNAMKYLWRADLKGNAIEDLEKVTRGPYAGCIGYFSFSGNLDSCITIRTIIVHNGKAYIQAGAGIVSINDPRHFSIMWQHWLSFGKQKKVVNFIPTILQCYVQFWKNRQAFMDFPISLPVSSRMMMTQMLTNQHQVMQQVKLNHLNILKSLNKCLVKMTDVGILIKKLE